MMTTEQWNFVHKLLSDMSACAFDHGIAERDLAEAMIEDAWMVLLPTGAQDHLRRYDLECTALSIEGGSKPAELATEAGLEVDDTGTSTHFKGTKTDEWEAHDHRLKTTTTYAATIEWLVKAVVS